MTQLEREWELLALLHQQLLELRAVSDNITAADGRLA